MFWKPLCPERASSRNQKRSITEGRYEEFWQRVQHKVYSIEKHLEKTLTQIYVWSLLINFEYHQKSLLKVLDDAYIPMETSWENSTTIVIHVIWNHQISFQE